MLLFLALALAFHSIEDTTTLGCVVQFQLPTIMPSIANGG